MKLRYALAAAVLLTGLAATAARADPATPPQQVCSTQSTNDCMNIKGGVNSPGTDVITYNRNNLWNDFEWSTIGGYCGGGKVTGTCPFSNQSFDNRYINDPIVEIKDTAGGNLCAAEDNWSILVLEGCGANGYVNVLSAGTFLVSTGATNHYGVITWVVDAGYRNPIEYSQASPNGWSCVGC